MTSLFMLGVTTGLIAFLLQRLGIMFRNWQWWAICFVLGAGWAATLP